MIVNFNEDYLRDLYESGKSDKSIAFNRKSLESIFE